MDSMGGLDRNPFFSKRFPDINGQTWDMFYNASENKRVILFGTGILANRHYQNYKYVLGGAVDNDSRRWGAQLKQFVIPAMNDVKGEVVIESPNILKGERDVVVLIANAHYYEDIIEQLNGYGIDECYVLKIMEINEKSHVAENPLFSMRPEGQIRGWAEKYSKEEIIPNKIFFFDHRGTFSGHGKYITLQLLNMNKKYDIVWAVLDMSIEVPQGVRLINKLDSETYLKEIETAKVWVFDHVLPMVVIKRPEQIYVNVKHWASITLKTFGMDLEKFRNGPLGRIYTKNANDMDYILVGSEFDIASCRTGYSWDGEFVNVGSARSDVLFQADESLKQNIYKKYNIEGGKKCALFAPTYRHKDGGVNNESTSKIDLDFKLLRDTLERTTGEEWIILLRLHPLVMTESYKVKKEEFLIDVSVHHDVQELVAISELLITDYSSIMFEPAFVKKPVFLFATDLKDYILTERDLLIDYYSLPFPIAETNAELAQNISGFSYSEYKDKLEAFWAQYGICEDGRASQRAAEFISKLIE